MSESHKPIFGFRRSRREPDEWDKTIVSFQSPYRLKDLCLDQSEALAGLVLIMDARHPLTALDRQMLDWFALTGKPVHVLLSKADKLSNSERAQTLRRVRAELAGMAQVSVQLFSSLSKLGADEAAAHIESWLQTAAASNAPPAVAGAQE